MLRKLCLVFCLLWMAMLVAGCKIEGAIKTKNSVGLSGVAVTLSNGNQSMVATTDSNGKYTFNNISGCSYTVTPQKALISSVHQTEA
jgi:hypothetical protein